MAIFTIGFKIKIAPPVALTAPHQRAAANVVSAYPPELLYLVVRVFNIIDKELFRNLIVSITFALDGTVLFIFFGAVIMVRQLPDVLFCSGVVFNVFYISTPFQH